MGKFTKPKFNYEAAVLKQASALMEDVDEAKAADQTFTDLYQLVGAMKAIATVSPTDFSEELAALASTMEEALDSQVFGKDGVLGQDKPID
jgi:hypothetical protein